MRSPSLLLCTCTLPWRTDNTLDEAAFRRHIRQTLRLGYRNIYLMGTAGEGYALNDRQFEEVVSVFHAETLDPAAQPMVGVISLSMTEVIDRICFAHGLGIRQFQISLPAWHAVSDSEMLCFFERVCGAFPDSVFLHYNLARTKRVLNGRDYRRIADLVPNLVATKQAAPDFTRIVDLMTHAPDLQHCYDESVYAFGCLFGECSLLAGYAHLFPMLIQNYFRAGVEGRIADLMRSKMTIQELTPVLFSGLDDVPRVDGAYDKLCIWLRDPDFPLRLLPPYEGVSQPEAERTRKILEERLAGLD